VSTVTDGFTLKHCSKIFGPVLAVGGFSTEEEAIELANNTRYGLGAGLHSSGSPVPLSDVIPPWMCGPNRVLLIPLRGCEPSHARFVSVRCWYSE
jgi:hypothetical protein